MSSPIRITVVTSPKVIDAGQMIQVSAIVTDKFGAPVVVPELLMEILDSKGRVYWNLAPIERNRNGFSKLISTNEMRHNTRYTVRVSTNASLSPQGFTFFKTSNRKLIPALIPALLLPNVLIPKRALDPTWLVYRTELDSKVCPICKPNEGKKFRPNDERIIRIGPSEFGGETHHNCRCHYDMILNENPAQARVNKILGVVKAVIAVKKFKEKEMIA